MRSTALQAMCALLLMAGNACNDAAEPGNPDPPDIVSVLAVRVTPQVIQFAAIGETRRLVATISPANATDQAITWESTDSGVATVDAEGLVTARAAGSGVFITAYTHDGHHEASVNVSVNP
jgi:alpha-L-fucosidase 2